MSRGGASGDNGSPIGKGALRPRARILRTLGDDLISSDKVALIELVKNSYDADASSVVIRFVGPLDEGEGAIEVWDDGHGMDVPTLQSSWLEIGTDAKRRKQTSDSGRRLLGEKGIGRLAAARLSSELLLVTRMPDATEVELLIDWTQFDREGAYLEDIEVAWEVGEPKLFSEGGAADAVFAQNLSSGWKSGHGTVLQMERLNHAWGRQDFLDLRTALTRLVRVEPSHQAATGRDGTPATSDFQIHVELVGAPEELEQFAGQIDPYVDLRTPHYSLRGSVDENGAASLHYRQEEPPDDEDALTTMLWTNGLRPPQVGPFSFEINVWDRDNDAIRRTLESTLAEGATPTVKDLKGFRDVLDDLAGVSIYRDGFRVLPFGERGDDWLGLDLRRVQSPTRRLSNNQIIGSVFLGADTNPGLRDQSNREGFLAGTAYEDLRVLVLAALSDIEVRRYKVRHAKVPEEGKRPGLFDKFGLAEIRTALAASYPGDKRLIGLVDEKERDIQAGVKEVQSVLSRYSRLATLGSLVDRILHDGRTAVTRVKNLSRFATRDLQAESTPTDERLSAALVAFRETALQADSLSSMFNHISPFGGRKRGRPKQLHSSEIIRSAIEIMRLEADDHGVTLASAGEDHVTRLDESEVLAVLVNLLQNAIYWTATQPKEHDRKVVVSARTNTDGSLTLAVSDSGPGVPVDIREHVFDPYFSSKPEGIGLGLSIVGNIVEDIYGGELALVEEGPLEGATFEATFRRRVQ